MSNNSNSNNGLDTPYKPAHLKLNVEADLGVKSTQNKVINRVVHFIRSLFPGVNAESAQRINLNMNDVGNTITQGAGAQLATHPALKDKPVFDGAAADNTNESALPDQNVDEVNRFMDEHPELRPAPAPTAQPAPAPTHAAAPRPGGI